MSAALRETRSVCCFCGVGCGVVAISEGDRIVGVRGDDAHPANRGALCTKGLALAETVQTPNRLLFPQARAAKDAPLARVTWNAALDRAAAGLRAARSTDAIGFYLSGQLLTEDYYAFNKLARGFLGTPHVDSNSRLCMSSAVAGYQRAFGVDGPPCSYDDLDAADLFLVVGANMAWCHPVLFRRIEAARATRRPQPGLVVLDPRRTATAAVADVHVALRPGSDALFATALLAELWRRGRLDDVYRAASTENFEALAMILPDFDAARVERDCGVPRATFEAVVDRFAAARSVLTLWAMGVNQSANGTDTVNALLNLHLATGQLGRPGAGPFSLTGQPNAMGGREAGAMATLLPGHRDPRSAADRADVAAFWKSPPLAKDPGCTAVELFEHAAEGGLDVLWIAGSNPAVTLPDTSRVRAALARTPLVIVQDIAGDTDTARFADLLLPAAGWGEKAGTMTNSERRIARLGRAVAPPGEARADWQIAARVAERLGFGDAFAWRDERDVFAEHVALSAGRDCDMRGISTERLAEAPLQWPCPDPSHAGTARLYADGRFPTPSGRARFVVPQVFAAARSESITLLTARDRDQWHTMTRTGHVPRLLAHAPEPWLEVAPGDATRLGIADGDAVRTRSERGAFAMRAVVTDALPEGVACAPMHWSDAFAPDALVNAAIPALLDPYSKQPELKRAPVRIERIGAGEATSRAAIERRQLCVCRDVSFAAVAAAASCARSVDAVGRATGAGTVCGSCRPEIAALLPKQEDAMRETLVVVGNGMVGHRFVESLLEAGGGERFRIVVLGEESRAAYDRVHLSELFAGRTAGDLAMERAADWKEQGVDVRLGARAVAIDRERGEVTTSDGECIAFDRLVLATGSSPFVPPVPGASGPDVFVYRTIEDVDAIRARAVGAQTGIVIGGGLLGLEAAKALLDLGLETHVVEAGPRLMPRQLDDAGAAALRRRIEALGVHVHVGRQTLAIDALGDDAAGDPDDALVADDPAFADAGASTGVALQFADGGRLVADLVVVSAGIRPRDELATAGGLQRGARGGVVVDDELRTDDPRIHAIGEVALHRGAIYGLVAPGYAMADTLAWNLANGASGAAARRFEGADLSTQLKLLGVDVASLGDPFEEASRTIVFEDQVRDVYTRLVLSKGSERLLGGVLVGDTSRFGALLELLRSGIASPLPPEVLLFGAAVGGDAITGDGDTAQICSCNNVSQGALKEAIRAQDGCTLASLKRATKAGTGCGGCLPAVAKILEAELAASGHAGARHLCEHFAYSRQELFQIVKVTRTRSFDALLESHGRGDGCEICKPAVASILASLWNDLILEQDTIQDTNDRFLANIQRGGTYSVIPRIAGGEITPAKLIALGEVAQRYQLYCKITGGQRVDLLGARVDQLPDIWRDLVEAGFESGHAYGKAMRTVKSCVGSTWCRFGVQDSTALAIRIEERYRGIRAPHKLKGAVSGCIRECAEAQSKDFGVIATEKGWNLYVCGNGGSKPRHAELLAADLDEATLIRSIDRFLMFYIETADRLTRTARWLEELPGGVDYLRKVVMDDHLGIAAELESRLQHLVDTYECEWKRVVDDPALQRRFRHFADSNEPDEAIAFVEERGQRRPADWQRAAPAPAPDLGALAETSSWVPLASVDEIPRDGGIAVRHGEVQIAIFHVAARDAWYATQNRCPHTGDNVLARGLVGDAGGRPKVACPQHKKSFDLETGTGLSDPEYGVAAFPVKVEDGKVLVKLPPADALAWRLGATNCNQAAKGGCNVESAGAE
jgi:nitrite reductase (NADH) large subunit